MKNHSRTIVLAALLFGVGACSAMPVGQGDSETHWLRECNSTAECGTAGSCVCGLCTLPCASDNECSGGPGGTCLERRDTSFCTSYPPPSGGICAVKCSRNADCSVDQQCLSGVCVTDSAPERAKPNTVTSGDGGAVTFALGGMGPNLSDVAVSVSRDGSVAVGTAVVGYDEITGPNSRDYEPMVWKAGGTAESLTCPRSSPCVGICGEANGVNGDGSVVVGYCNDDQGLGLSHAFRTSPSGLDLFGPGGSIGYGANADGSVLVGTYTPSGSDDAGVTAPYSFRWTNGGLQDLGRVPGATDLVVLSVSSDGSTASGTYDDTNSRQQAFLWSLAAGLQPVQIPHGGYFDVWRMSSDGTVVVGQTDRGAATWSTRDGLTLLGCSQCAALGVNRDGSVVVGGNSASPAIASAARFSYDSGFVWDAKNGLRDLLTLLRNAGVDLGDIDDLDARDVSDDGTVIVGQAHHPGTTETWEAFRATLPR